MGLNRSFSETTSTKNFISAVQGFSVPSSRPRKSIGAYRPEDGLSLRLGTRPVREEMTVGHALSRLGSPDGGSLLEPHTQAPASLRAIRRQQLTASSSSSRIRLLVNVGLVHFNLRSSRRTLKRPNRAETVCHPAPLPPCRTLRLPRSRRGT
jgi:hypothetical protein